MTVVTETNDEIYLQPSPDCIVQDILDECFRNNRVCRTNETWNKKYYESYLEINVLNVESTAFWT